MIPAERDQVWPALRLLPACGSNFQRNGSDDYGLLESLGSEGHGPLSRRRSGRLASRAAAICSGVRTSGSESLTFSRERETWRLWRLASLLSIRLFYLTSVCSAAGRRRSLSSAW